MPWRKRRRKSTRSRRIPLNAWQYGAEEWNAVRKLWATKRLTQGDRVAEFEAAIHDLLDLPQSRSVAMVNSGSSANLLAACLLAKARAEMRPGCNEVITPALTWSTTVAPLVQFGFTPVFADVGPDLTMDPNEVDKLVNEKTLGILPVHLLGHAAPMDTLAKIARENDLFLAEDCCEALGARSHGRLVGSWGHAASFSTYFSHHASTIEGGMLIYPARFHEVRAWREHGWTRSYPESVRRTLAAANPTLDPRWLFDELGYNVRSTDLAAVLGLAQLPKLAGWMDERRAIAGWYLEFLAHEHLEHPFTHADAGANPFSYPLVVAEDAPFSRRELMDYLESYGVETRPVMTGNITQHPWYKRHSEAWRAAELPRTDRVHSDGFLLPVHPGMIRADLDHVRNVIHAFLKEHSGEGLG